MNYLIVMPILTNINEQSYFFPIGIAYVSASLKQTGRTVITYNLNYKPGTIKENLERVIYQYDIGVIATGGLTGQYWQLLEILEAAREIKPDIITWVGGGIITSAPETAMEAFSIADYGMIGEGEITICELAEAMEGKRDIHSVDGIVFKENGRWVQTAPRKEIEDLDSLPYPDYDGFEYSTVLEKLPTDLFALNQGRFGFVSFGRSCPFRCTFCFHPSGTKYRKRSMNSVFKEIDFLIEKYNIKNINVTDELFVRKIEDVREFCERIKERKIGFIIQLRVDMVNREMLTLLRDAGCLSVGFGLESADNGILKSMKKHITVEQIENALSLCHDIGLNCMGGFIFGDQNETMETAMNTINWWKNHPQYRIALALIIPFPGSELYNIAVAKKIISDPVQYIKDGCPYINFSKMTDQEYKDMAILISVLSPLRSAFLKNTSVEYVGFGKVNLSGECPECGKMNVWTQQDLFTSKGNVICSHCHNSMNVIAADYVGDIVEKNFSKLKRHKIGIWPMLNSVSEFIEKCPSASNDNVFLIDSAKVKQGGRYKGKEVFSPSVIDDKQIDIVFVATTTHNATQIIYDLQTKHPSVKHIMFLGDLMKNDFALE